MDSFREQNIWEILLKNKSIQKKKNHSVLEVKIFTASQTEHICCYQLTSSGPDPSFRLFMRAQRFFEDLVL